MKKLIIILLFSLLCFSLYAQQNAEEQDLFYINVPIVRVYDHIDAYVVHYLKGNMEVGQVFVPKVWFNQHELNKSRVRPLAKGLDPYMTVIYESGTFRKVFINMPVDRKHSAWKILSRNVDVASKMNTETLEIEY